MKSILKILSNKINFPSKNDYAKVEYLGLGKISGWVFNRESKLTEVRLVWGNKIVSKCPIEIERGDVCQKYNYEGTPGFQMELPSNVRNLDKDADISLIALSSNGQKVVDCIDRKNKKKIYGQIREIFDSPHLGIQGNLDGLQSDGLIHGWASWIYLKKTAWVYLQCEGLDPIAFKCNNLREEVIKLGFKTQKIGFIIDPQKLDKSYSEKIFNISFDEEGKYLLPREKVEKIPKIFSEEEVFEPSLKVINKNESIGYVENIYNSPKNLKDAWIELENFRLYLDGLEHQLDRVENLNILKKELSLKKNFFKKFKSIITKNY